MAVSRHIPGAVQGNVRRNLVVLAVYFVTFPVWLTFAPIFVAVIVGFNAKGWADELSPLPGISPGGGLTSAITAFAYVLLFWLVLFVTSTAL